MSGNNYGAPAPSVYGTPGGPYGSSTPGGADGYGRSSGIGSSYSARRQAPNHPVNSIRAEYGVPPAYGIDSGVPDFGASSSSSGFRGGASNGYRQAPAPAAFDAYSPPTGDAFSTPRLIRTHEGGYAMDGPVASYDHFDGGMMGGGVGEDRFAQQRLESQLSIMKTKMSSIQEENTHLKSDLQRSQERARDLETQNRSLQERLSTERDSAQQELNTANLKASQVKTQYMHREETVSKENRELRDRIKELDKVVETLRSDLSSLQDISRNQVMIVENQRAQFEDEARQVQGSYEHRIHELEMIREEQGSRIHQLETEYAESLRRLEQDKYRNEEALTGGLRDLRQMGQELKAAVAKVEGDYRGMRSQVAAAMKEADDENEHLSFESRTLTQENGTLKEQIHFQSIRMEEMQSETGALREELAELRSVKQIMEEQSRRQQQEKANTINKLELRIKSLEEEIHSAKKQLQEQQDVNRNLAQQRESTEDEARNLADDFKALRIRLESENQGFSMQIGSLSEDLERARESIRVAKQREESMMKDIRDRQALADDLHDKWQLTLRDLQTHQRMLDEQNDQFQQRSIKTSERIKSLQEEIVMQRSMFQNELESIRILLDQKQREIRKLQQDLDAAAGVHSQVQQGADERRRELDNMRASYQALAEENNELKRVCDLRMNENEQLREQISTKVKEREEVERQLRTLKEDNNKELIGKEKEKKQLDAVVAKARGELEQSQGLLNVVQGHRKTLQEENKKLASEITALQEQKRLDEDRMRGDMQRDMMEISKLQREKQVMDAEMAALKRELATLATDRDDLADQVADLELKMQQQMAYMQGSSEQNRSLENSMAIVAKAKDALTAECERLKANLRSTEEELRQLREMKTTSVQTIYSLESEKNSMVDRFDALSNNLHELQTKLAKQEQDMTSLKAERDAMAKKSDEFGEEKQFLIRKHEKEIKENRDQISQLQQQLRQAQAMLILAQSGKSRTSALPSSSSVSSSSSSSAIATMPPSSSLSSSSNNVSSPPLSSLDMPLSSSALSGSSALPSQQEPLSLSSSSSSRPSNMESNNNVMGSGAASVASSSSRMPNLNPLYQSGGFLSQPSQPFFRPPSSS